MENVPGGNPAMRPVMQPGMAPAGMSGQVCSKHLNYDKLPCHIQL